MVGRDHALRVLNGALATTPNRDPSVVLVRGEPGIGKSRLVREFGAGVDRDHLQLWGTCLNIADPPAYGAMVSIIRGARRALEDSETEHLVPEQTRAQLTRFLDDGGITSGASGDPRTSLFESVVALFDGLAAARTLVLVIEDAHWIDRSSWDLLTYVIHELDQHPVLTVVTHRTLPHGHRLRLPLLELSRLRQVTGVELTPLPPDQVAEQVAGLVGVRPGPERLASVMARSGGNPFFVEMLAGDPAAGEGRIREHLVGPFEDLPEAGRQVLRVVAVAAPYVGHRLLAAVTDLPEPQLDEAVRRAIDAGMLSVEGDGYRFRHALLGDAVYEDVLLPGERTQLHRRLASAIDADPGLARPEHYFAASEAGRHWEAGDDPTYAIEAYWRSATEARDFDFLPERVAMLDRVLHLWGRVPDARPLLGVSRAEVMMHVVEAADLSGDVELGISRADAAIGAALAEDQPETAAVVLERRARMRRRMGLIGATEDLLEALRITESTPVTPLHARLTAFLAQRYLLAGHDQDEVVDTAAGALDLADRVADPFAATHARLTFARISAIEGELEESQRRYREARQAASAVPGGGILLVRSFLDEASALIDFGELAQAADTARRGMRLASDLGLLRTSAPHAAAHLADPLIGLGSWDEAWEVIEAALAAAPPRGYCALLLRLRARISMWRGDSEAAAADLEQIRRMIGPRFETPEEQFAVAQLETEAHLIRGDPEGAWRVVEQALDTYPEARGHSPEWGLLALGARALRQRTAALTEPDRDRAHRGLERLHARSEGRPCRTPREQAWRATFLATTAEGSRRWSARRDEIDAWRRTHEPAMLAAVLIAAAHDAPDRQAAAEHLREAAGLAALLGADALTGAAASAADMLGVGTEDPVVPAPESVGDATARSWGLTPREAEVLEELAEGKTNREIAAALFITPKTASVHVSRILMKMGAATRGEATAKAFRHRAVSLEPGPAP